MKMMRSLLPSRGVENHRKGRSSSPTVATPPNNVISSLPLGSTDQVGYSFKGVISGITAQTQAQQVADYQGILQYLAPQCYGIRGSYVATNVNTNSNNVAAEGFSWGTSTADATGFTASAGGNGWARINNQTGKKVIIAAVLSVPSGTGRVQFYTGGAAASFVDIDSIPRTYVSSILDGASYCGLIKEESGGRVDVSDWEMRIVDPLTWDSAGYTFIPTNNIPATKCYDHLPDGTLLRPFYSFQGTHRYDVFRPTELARNMAFNVGECIEAVASDGIRRYYRASAIVGAELIIDGDFNTPAAWSLGISSFISGGRLVHTSSGTSDNYQAVGGYAVGKSYVTIVDVVSASGVSNLIFATDVDLPSFSAAGVQIFKHLNTPQNYPYIDFQQTNGSEFTIESVSSREILAATSGTTGATSPVFPPTGGVVDGNILWEAAGYATIMGLELDKTGSVNHPEGVVLHLDDLNFETNDILVCFDFLPDVVPIDEQLLSLATSAWFNFSTASKFVQWIVNGVTRQCTNPATIGIVSRIVARLNTINQTLYENGAMFIGGSGGLITKNNAFFFGTGFASNQIKGCLLNFCVLKDSAMNDAQATARSAYDKVPSQGFNALTGAESTSV